MNVLGSICNCEVAELIAYADKEEERMDSWLASRIKGENEAIDSIVRLFKVLLSSINSEVSHYGVCRSQSKKRYSYTTPFIWKEKMCSLMSVFFRKVPHDWYVVLSVAQCRHFTTFSPQPRSAFLPVSGNPFLLTSAQMVCLDRNRLIITLMYFVCCCQLTLAGFLRLVGPSGVMLSDDLVTLLSRLSGTAYYDATNVLPEKVPHS